MTDSIPLQRAAPAGSWRSPITVKTLSQAGVRLSQPTANGDKYYWLEGRPAERGRTVLVQADEHGNKKDLNPAPYDVRSRVHEYGSGSYLVCAAGIFFINAEDQGIYRIGKRRCQRIFCRDDLRLTDMVFDAPRNRLIAIAEDHDRPGEPENFLCAIGLEDGAFEALHRGADFYSSPTLSHDGKQLAWLTWMHPNLPWDETRLHLAELGPDSGPLTDTIVRQGEAIFQPRFGPDNDLYFISDADGWWNFYVLRFSASAQSVDAIQLTHEPADFGAPQWVFGISLYGFKDANTIIAARVRQGLWDAVQIEIASGAVRPLYPWPFNTVEHLVTDGRNCVCIAGGGGLENSIVAIDSDRMEYTTLQTASPAAWPPELLSQAENLRFATSENDVAYAFYYAPCNPRYRLNDDEKPPLIVNVHGGPTTANTASLNPRFQFWTSRGFAILDVNYRGSTGYGRDYRRKLDAAWGIRDVADCVHGAQHLVAAGRVDPHRLFIMGGSAGGYTVLCALAYTDVFNGGISSYGIGDLAVLVNDTHKFEARYADRLIGPFDAELYRQRSPLYAVQNIDAPVLFFQGTEDKVVPPNQTEDMVAALKSRQVSVAYVSMQGEGHGFRRSDSIEKMLAASLTFLCRLSGCTPADGAADLHIDNDHKLQTR